MIASPATNAKANSKHMVIMAAGTGGHIFPGIAIADEMLARGWTVSWLGTASGMETHIVPKHGIDIDTINFSGVRGKGLSHTLSGLGKLLLSFVACWRILGKRKADLILGMGGYVTVPGGLIAALRLRPLVLMNADAGLLLSNKILRPLAKKILFGLPSTKIADSNNVVVTGNAIRRAICELPQPNQRYAARSGPLKILIVGGSLGARILNEIVPRAIAQLAPENRPTITHQSGKSHLPALRASYAALNIDAEVLEFIDDMPRQYSESDLVICRAGAITISELTAAGVASLLVPFVASSTTHQTANAKWMEAEQAAIFLPQAKLDVTHLTTLLSQLDREKCQAMAQAAYALGQRNASQTIATILEKLV